MNTATHDNGSDATNDAENDSTNDSTNDAPDYGGPWYRHFWPWFIVCLLGSTVAAGLVTVFIAVRGADPLVVDDYYRDGKAINRHLEADREAALREAHARVAWGTPVRVALEILGAPPAVLELELSHATRVELDRRILLERTAEGDYRSQRGTQVEPSDTGPLAAGPYYATLRPAGGGAWRLRGRVQLPSSDGFRLEPRG